MKCIDSTNGVFSWVCSNWFERIFKRIFGMWRYHCFRCWLAENGLKEYSKP